MPGWVTRFLLRARATLSGGHDRELREELLLHLRLLEEEHIAQGCSLDEARRRARREFGNPVLYQETSHDLFAFRTVERFLQDLRYAVRETRRSLGFTCVAIASLAVGIGSLTASFSVVDAFLLRGLPVHDPHRLVALSTIESSGWGRWPFAAFTHWRESPDRLFEAAAASDVNTYEIRLRDGGTPAEVRLTLVSGNYFDVIGADVAVGRALTEADDSPRSAVAVAVISYAFWQRGFGRTSDILSRTVDLQGRSYAIVGVAGRRFTGHAVGQPTDVWIPLVKQPELMPDAQNLLDGRAALEPRWLRVIGRLGVDIGQAGVSANLLYQRFVAAKAAQLGETNPDVARDRKQVVTLLTATKGFAPERERYARPVWILSAVTALVFLVACANFANLMLARTERRSREFAIRLALGAGCWRLVRQSATECALLAGIAGTLGLLLAAWASTTAVKQFAVMIIPVELSLQLDARMLTFAAGLVVAAVAFGLLPSLRLVRFANAAAVYQAAHAHARARARKGVGRAVLVVQMAICAVLLIGAGLLFRSVVHLRSQELGFDRNVLLVPVSPRRGGYGDDAAALLVQRIRDRLAAVPGIQAVGVSGPALLDPTHYWIDDSQRLSTDEGMIVPGARWTLASVGPDFFQAVGIAVVHGRGFDDQDSRPSSDAVIINRSLASVLFGGEDPLGRGFRTNLRSPMLSVVGVVSDAKQTSPRDRGMGVIYAPLRSYGRVVLAVRTTGLPSDMAPVVMHQIDSIVRNLPMDKSRTIAEVLDAAIAQERLMSGIALLLSALVVAIGGVGLYALMSYEVVQRTHELGVRLTLGATSRSVVVLVLTDAFKLVMPALAIGIPLGIIGSGSLAPQLYEVQTTDPWTITSVGLLMAGLALAATITPAQNASRIDPVALLRSD